jgi:hypothetical protein
MGQPLWAEEYDRPVLVPSVHQRACLMVTDDEIRNLKFISEKAPEQTTRDQAQMLHDERVEMKRKGDQLRRDFDVIM